MTERAEIVAAGAVAGRRVYSELQTVGVQPVAQTFHVGELLVHGDGAVGVPLRSFPCVVNVDVAVAVVGEPFLYEGTCRRHHFLLRYAEAPTVPAVPAHGRCERYLVSHLYRERLFCLAFGVLCHDGHLIVAALSDASAYHTVGFIECETFRKIVHGELHRTLARHRYAEDDG